MVKDKNNENANPFKISFKMKVINFIRELTLYKSVLAKQIGYMTY